MLVGLDVEGEFLDEDVTVRGDDRHVSKFDEGACGDLAAAAEDGGVLLGRCRGDEFLFEVAILDVGHDVEEGGDARSVASELGNLLVGEHDAAESIG